MRLIDADELIEHAWRDKLDSRELIAEMIEKAPTIKEIPTNIPIDVFEKLISQKPRWIPCSERLPKVADCYAVTRKSGSDLTVSACYFDGINTWHNDNWINHERNYLTDIVAWMPLPEEPYKAESEST